MSTVTITQTVACNQSQDGFVVVTTPSITSTYSANYSKGPYRIKIRDFEGGFSGFADSDASFAFFDDGRLKSINQSTTGQGEAVIKSAVTLATTISAAAAGFDASVPIPTLKAECDAITAAQPVPKTGDPPASGAVTFSYQFQFDDTLSNMTLGKPIPVDISPGSQKLFDTIFKRKNVASKVRPQIKIGPFEDTRGRVKYANVCGASEANVVELELKNTGSTRIDVLIDNDVGKLRSIWNASVTLPRSGTYCLPIPRAALFGKQNFSLTLTEAGAIAAVDYGKTNEAPPQTDEACRACG